MSGEAGKGSILFNPVSIVHYRNIDLFRDLMPGWRIKKIIDPRRPWFSGRPPATDEIFFSGYSKLPRSAFDDVKAVVVFSAQPRIPPCLLIGEAALRRIPVVAIEEVLQMMIEQGYVSEYFLPVDRLFAGSEIERKGFMDFGIPSEAIETTGCAFGYIKPEAFDETRRAGVMKKLGLSGTKKVAVLSLAYQTPSGETLAIRRRLIETVSRGLPADYELVVKPHPAEQDPEVEKFIKAYAPAARVADKYVPIGDILGVADILFNRGNSQVVIDAFNRGLPVVVVPAGRKTFFDGVLNEVIVKDEKDVRRALDFISAKGFSVYGPVIRLYSQIPPEEALKRAAAGIIEAAEGNGLFEPEQRLADLAVYWAWMGYTGQSRRILLAVKERIESKLYLALGKLNMFRATRSDLGVLKDWGRRRYRSWLLKSMWIKTLFLSDAPVDEEDIEWLSDFPPRMNREYFMNYTCMLLWSLLRSGRRPEYEGLMKKVYEEYSFLKCIKDAEARGRQAGRAFSPGYWRMKIGSSLRSAFNNLSL